MWVMECPSLFPLQVGVATSQNGAGAGRAGAGDGAGSRQQQAEGVQEVAKRTVLYASMLGEPFMQYHQEAWVGDFNSSSGRLGNITHHTVLDYGLWYAAKGHVPSIDPTTHIVFGWMHCLDVDECSALTTVCGDQYTLPRLITLSEDGLEMRLRPLPALLHLHKQSQNGSEVVHHKTTILPGDGRNAFIKTGHTTSPLHGSVLHINALLPCSLQKSLSFFGMHILSNADRTETTNIGWDVALGRVSVDRNASGANRTSTGPQTAPVPEGCKMGAFLNITVVVDGGVVETYVNDKFAITVNVFLLDLEHHSHSPVHPSNTHSPERDLGPRHYLTRHACTRSCRHKQSWACCERRRQR
jgi:sucrose-6-phosphate hydrolase SacC (GH32 family)